MRSASVASSRNANFEVWGSSEGGVELFDKDGVESPGVPSLARLSLLIMESFILEFVAGW